MYIKYLEKPHAVWYSIVTPHTEKSKYMKNATSTIKKSMLWVILTAAAVLVLLVLLIQILSRYTESTPQGSQETNEKPHEFKFSDEYITNRDAFEQDEEYLNCDRTIYFHNPQTGVTEGIEEGSYESFNGGTELLCEMLSSIINGDAELYNTFFSDIYFESNKEKAPFSMQKLYDILITEYSVSEETNESGGTYKEYIYELKYKIRNNNGSFRRDIGSDMLRAQYILITNRGGKLEIDKIFAYGE